MRFWPGIGFAALCLALCGTARAQTPLDLPFKFLNVTRRFEVAADGSYTVTTHQENRILAAAAIASAGEGVIPYGDTLQQVEVTEAYTRKADGRVLPVAAESILTRQVPAANVGASMTDLKQKVILYPNVEVGDTVVNTAVMHSQPLLPGYFFYNTIFPTSQPVDDVTVSISLPKSVPANVESSGLTMQKTEMGDRVVYTVQQANPRPVSFGPQAVSEFDRAPRFSLSTFKDYDEFAKVYAGLARPMAEVTPAIRAQADQITEGVTDRRDQARRIYQWAAGHVRYLALEFGQGGIVPHSAGSVLANGYGDCKDHAVLFDALLRAKGIDSRLVLINATDSYTVPQAPNATSFNHMISWLPEFEMYADTTNGSIAPFGLLPRSEYGKTVIHIADPGGAVHRVPLSDGGNSNDSYKLTIRMDDEGHMESESSSTATGDFAGPLRMIGARLQGENGKTQAMAMLAKTPMPQATGAFMAPPLDLDAVDYRIAATYAPPQPISALAAGASFRMGDNLKVADPIGPVFFGPVLDSRFRNADPLPCYSGRSSDDETLQFPATRHVDKLPADVDIKTAHITYTSRWSQTATSIHVRREFDARFDTALCGPAVRDEVMGALAKIQADAAAGSFALPRD